MAQPWNCDSQDDTPAFLVMTRPETGDVTALCAPCLLDWCETMLSQAGRMDEAVERYIAANMAAAQAAEPKPKRARKGAAATTAAPPQDTPAGDASTAEPATDPAT